MSFRARVEACHSWDPDAHRPFVIDDAATGPRVLGRIKHGFAHRLADFADCFEVSERAVRLHPGLADFASRSAAVDAVVRRLVDAGDIRAYRNEDYGVQLRWHETAAMKLDRGAVPSFGTRGFGIHVNGLVEGGPSPEDLQMWVGRRALDKATAPGKLDHLIAGGQPYGVGLQANLEKEAAEEADVPAELAAQARPVGMISYRCERDDGLRDDVVFCYDLVLPPGFTPRNTDGEVDHFMLWPIGDVMARVRDSDDFKFNCNLVVLHLMVRRGLIGFDHPDYEAIIDGFHLTER